MSRGLGRHVTCSDTTDNVHIDVYIYRRVGDTGRVATRTRKVGVVRVILQRRDVS